ncbi:hypothetical protein [Embleya sp. AB8]|uniref:hypothetical protein n=1 Tax=Embleya sp. AB8 TaxID=3156304 RepID=UPI003C7167B5
MRLDAGREERCFDLWCGLAGHRCLATLVAFSAAMPQVAVDEAIGVFDLVMGDLIRFCVTKQNKKRPRAANDPDAAAPGLRTTSASYIAEFSSRIRLRMVVPRSATRPRRGSRAPRTARTRSRRTRAVAGPFGC